MNEQEQPQDNRPAEEPLGQVLIAARRRKNLSIDQVASHLMLSREVIMGLESDNYQGLPEITFVRGYLRSYLRLVDLPESRLEAFDRENRDRYPELRRNRAGVPGADSSTRWIQWTTIGVVVVLVVALILWMMEQYLHLFSDPEGFLHEAAITVERVYPGGDREKAGTDAPVSRELDLPRPENPVDTDENDVVTISASDDTIQPVTEVPVAEITVPEEPVTDQLELSFSGECWIRVLDADGKKLESGTFHNGDVISVSGKPPYSLTLGRAANVVVKYNGEVLELPVRNSGTTRMKIGEPVQ